MNQIAIRNEGAARNEQNKSKLMLLDYMADKYSLTPDEFRMTVRATCGLATATPEQVAAFLIVAKEYNLNPLTKEIYAFPGRSGGVVPIVSIDGWVNLVNSNPQCDGFEFVMEHDGDKLVSCTCTMYRKDRTHPVSITEYLSECIRATEPWKMQHRMLRHKSMIQAARYAFGFAGIYDEDEGRVIAESIDVTPRDTGPPRIVHAVSEPEKPGIEISGDPVSDMPDELFDAFTPHLIAGEHYTAKTWTDAYIAAVETSTDLATTLKWAEANALQLKKLSKAMFATVEKATGTHQDFLAGAVKRPGIPDIATDYTGWVTWALQSIAKIEDAGELETYFAREVEAFKADIFPSDYDDCVDAYTKAQGRLNVDE